MRFPSAWFTSPQAQAYLQRNPNSMILRHMGAYEYLNKAPGGNNAAPSAPAGGSPPPATRPQGPAGGVFRDRMPARGSTTPPPNGAMFQNPANQMNAGGGGNNFSIPSFAAGGMMAPEGVAIRPGQGMQPSIPSGGPELGAASPAPLDPAQINQEVDKIMRSNPQVVEQTQGVVTAAIQSGELTSEELNMAVQLAKAALANPAGYPQIRQFAIQNGLGTEQDMPQEMDTGVLFALIAVGKAMQSNTQGAAPQAQAPTQGQPAGIVPEYKDGGMTGDKPHIAKLHPREYVVPEKALLFHGKKTFDRMVEQANEVPDDGQQAN
jgi:hypothetical protein